MKWTTAGLGAWALAGTLLLPAVSEADHVRHRGRSEHAYDRGFDRGLEDGARSGGRDGRHREPFGFWRDHLYRDGDSGYRGRYGSHRVYVNGYRAGYERGYREAYRAERRHDRHACYEHHDHHRAGCRDDVVVRARKRW